MCLIHYKMTWDWISTSGDILPIPGGTIASQKDKIMMQPMTTTDLDNQNRIFADTSGVSHNNWALGFIPAFLDQETGSVYISRMADGNPAPIHNMDGLPEYLVLLRDSSGRVCTIKGTVIAGFLRGGQFYTREQAAHAVK